MKRLRRREHPRPLLVSQDLERYAYSEILPDEQGATAAAFFGRAIEHFAAQGVAVEALITDNHFSYSKSNALRELLEAKAIRHLFIRPHCPWQNGKVERFNRTLQTEWAYRQVFTNNADRTAALAPWLNLYNTRRRHSALGGHPPISRLTPPT